MRNLMANFFWVVLLLISLTAKVEAQSYTIAISTGDLERESAVISFYFPDHVEEGVYRLTDGSGSETLLQVSEDNRGWIFLNHLSPGETITWTLDLQQSSESPHVTHEIDSSTISIQQSGREVLSYYHGYNNPPDRLDERYRRGGYIHPLRSPSGVVLTNHLNADGHPHHSGIWSAWTHTRFQGRTPDFWNVHLNTGRVDHADSLDLAWQGPVHAGFRSRHHFVDLSSSAPVIALNEQWDVRVYDTEQAGDYFMFDLEISQSVNTAQPLELPEYRYGGVGFRGHVDWDDPENTTFLTSEGEGRDGHGSRVRWTHIGGYSEGELAGVAILSHPSNYRHPQTVRIHPTEPFFNYAPVQLGDMVIEPGSPYSARYRYITYDGEPDPEWLDQMWQDYAYPPTVVVQKVE